MRRCRCALDGGIRNQARCADKRATSVRRRYPVLSASRDDPPKRTKPRSDPRLCSFWRLERAKGFEPSTPTLATRSVGFRHSKSLHATSRKKTTYQSLTLTGVPPTLRCRNREFPFCCFPLLPRPCCTCVGKQMGSHARPPPEKQEYGQKGKFASRGCRNAETDQESYGCTAT